MIKKLHIFLVFSLLLSTLTFNSIIHSTKSYAATGCADSKGSFSETTTAGYTTVTFTATSSLAPITNYETSTLYATCTWSAPAGLTAIEILIVAGGGGGGLANQAGGGGAGGVLYNQSLSISGGSDYSIKIGAGGSGGGNSKQSSLTNKPLTPAGNQDGYGRTGANGGISAFGAFESIGGGGGSGGGTVANRTPNSGGSGGGGAGYKRDLESTTAQSGAASNQADPDGSTTGWVSYGNSGSNGYNNGATSSFIRVGGGGGGAGGAGTSPTSGAGGVGGVGVTLLGVTVGGGGAGWGRDSSGNQLAGTAGSGGGGSATGKSGGVVIGSSSGDATNGTGGGGGASTGSDSGSNNGGSGIVVIKYGAATPSVVTNPSNVSNALENGSASFTVAGSITDTATGGALTYQWQRSTNSGSTWSDISGEIATTLSLSGLTTAMSGYQYRALLTNTRHGFTSTTTTSAATLTVRSIDATLSNLQYTPAGGSLTSVSEFTGSGTSYTFNVLTSQATVTIRPTATVAQSTITVNGTSVTSGTNSSAINLSTGYNTVTVVVTSQSGTVTQSISLTVIRQTNLCSPSTDSSTAYTVLTFTSVGICQWSVPSGVTSIDLLVVGGGGGGGYDSGGGGGGGGYAQLIGKSVTAGTIYFPTVGGGGAGASTRTTGTTGGTSSFDTTAATGGSGGGACNWNDSNCATNLGGSLGVGTGGSTVSTSTKNGGDGFCRTSTSSPCVGASPAINGSAGFTSSVAGITVSGGGGGGGGSATGGSGGGGNGGSVGTNGLGGGGGGGPGNAAGLSGGSGRVVVRYLNAPTITGTRISGALKVGQTLSIIDTVTTGTISSTTYQWSSSDTSTGAYSNISGATNSTYTLTNSEYGKFLKVSVTVTNSSGSSSHTSSATSTAVVYATPTIGGVSISGTSQVGETLTATTSSVTGSGTSTAYQWSSSSTLGGTYTNIAGATSSTYQVTSSDVAAYIKVTVTVTNDGGSATATSTGTLISAGAALTPTFGSTTATADGFTVQITNYSASYTWAGSATASGSVAISGSGLVTVTGVAPGTSSTATITTSRTGYTGGSATVTGTSINNANIITFNTIATQTFGSLVNLSTYVSASSGLPVTVRSTTTSICTIADGKISAISVGTCSLTASQSGDGSTLAASDVTSSFTVSKKSLTITISGINANFGSSISDPTYTQSGLVTSFGDAISTPTFYYTGTSTTYYPLSTTKPTQVGTYEISIPSISLSSGNIVNYQVSFVRGELVIASVASNTLTSMSIKATTGNTSSNLLNNFDNAITSYQIYVDDGVSAVTVTLTRASTSIVSAQVKINESGWRRFNFSSNSASSGVIPLPAATNTLLISTISSDKGVKQFTITIYRDTKTAPRTGSSASPVPTVSPTPANNAISMVRLLVNNSSDISSGLQTVNLSPTFNRSVDSYTASFTNTQSAAVLKADFTAAGVTLRLKINNGPFTSIPNTGASSTISLNVGSNVAILRVTSTDGTSVDYTFTLTRAEPLAGLSPTFGTPSPISGGFTVQISNYSSAYSWGVTASSGSASISETGLVTVTGLSGGSTSLTVTSRRSGYANARSTLTYP